jgi:hypothetical protein
MQPVGAGRPRWGPAALQRRPGQSTMAMAKRCLAMTQVDLDSANQIASPQCTLGSRDSGRFVRHEIATCQRNCTKSQNGSIMLAIDQSYRSVGWKWKS